MSALLAALTEVVADHPKADIEIPRTLTQCGCGTWFSGSHADHVARFIEARLIDDGLDRNSALKWAANEVHVEARWQTELDMRSVRRHDAAKRLAMVEEIIRNGIEADA